MKDWKTTITGLILAVLTAIQPYAENGDFDFHRDWLKFLVAICIAIVGYIMKDPKKAE